MLEQESLFPCALRFLRRSGFLLLTTLVAIGLAKTALAQSYYSSVRGQLNASISLFEEKCRGIGPELVERANRDELPLAIGQRVEITMCHCVPEKTRALLAQLSEEQLAEQIFDEADFIAITKPRVIDPCLGELMRSLFQGEGCEAIVKSLAGENVEPGRICPCMGREVEAISDSDAAAIGLQAADWIPAAAEARKANQPLPERPEPLARFLKSMEKCGAPGVPTE